MPGLGSLRTVEVSTPTRSYGGRHMLPEESLLVTLVRLVERIPTRHMIYDHASAKRHLLETSLMASQPPLSTQNDP